MGTIQTNNPLLLSIIKSLLFMAEGLSGGKERWRLQEEERII